MDLNKIKDRIIWDFKFEDEFKTRDTGYTFIIDVLNGKSIVALYRFTPFGIKSEPLENQPPGDMVNAALIQQGNDNMKDGLYYIDEDIKKWIQEHVIK